MNFKKLSLWGAAAGITVLVGCNLFNPNGAEESSCDAGNAECYIALGQSLIQQKSFDASMNAYAKAIEIDSSKSEAYLGYATAVTFKYNVNLGGILDDLTKAGGGDPTSFVNHSNEVVTDRILMTTAVVNILGRLSDRDTLTQWYEYLTDSSKAGSDPHFAARKAFIINYLDTSTAPSRLASKFPLTDRKKKFENQIFQYAPYFLMYTILNLYNLPPKDVFDDHDRIMMNLMKAFAPSDSGPGANLTDLAEQMRTDTVLKGQVNDKILELQSGLGDVSQILSFLNVNPADTAGAKNQSKKQIDSAISSLGGSLVFYQFGDKLDNDGDGCIDEEIVDSVDNDGDGFVDEDARLINGNGVTTGPADGVDNDQNGVKDAFDNPGEGLLVPNGPLTFVALSGEGANWVKIKKGDPNIDTRIQIQNDSLAVHLTPRVRPIPEQYQAQLDSAKTYIGGCWRNY